MLNDIGIDPNKDVSWLAVGEGSTAGVALTRGDIDALGYFDSGFGTIENAGIKLRYLPRPSKVPMIGGLSSAVARISSPLTRISALPMQRALPKRPNS